MPFAAQQPVETGTPSTSSLKDSESRSDRKALREGIAANEGLRTLGRMEAIDAMGDALANENTAAEREDRLNQAEEFGLDRDALEQSGADGMKVMAARDVYFNQTPKTLPENGAQPPAAPRPPAAQPSPSLLRRLAPHLITAALAGTLGGAGGLIPWLLSRTTEPPAVVAPTEPPVWALDLDNLGTAP